MILSIMDALTPAEQASPLEVIDSESIRRLAVSAGTTDQHVIQFLINWSGYVNGVAHANFLARDGEE